MGYGLHSRNINGVSQIDDVSIQLAIKKQGQATCGRFSDATSDAGGVNHYPGGGTGAICTIVPLVDIRDNCFVYAKPSKRAPQNQNLCFGMLYGFVYINMTAYGARAVGNNVIYVDETVTAATGGTDWNLYSWTDDNTAVYTVEDVVGSDLLNSTPRPTTTPAGQWGGLSSSATVTNVEYQPASGGPALWKITLSENLSTALLDNQVLQFEQDAIMFVRPEDEPWPTDIKIEYKICSKSNVDSSGYGLDIFTSSGDLGYSTDRITFNAEAPASTANVFGTLSTGVEDFRTASYMGPLVAERPGDELNYFAFMTGIAGPCAHIAGGYQSWQNNRSERGFRGWCFMYNWHYTDANSSFSSLTPGMWNKYYTSGYANPATIPSGEGGQFYTTVTPGRISSANKAGYNTLADYSSQLINKQTRVSMIGRFI